MDETTLARLRAAARGGDVGRDDEAWEAVPDGPAARDGGGIGMANLETRLAYRYAGSVVLAVASRPGRGTLVRISLPAQGIGDAV
jgi:sensor histidine kinase YesM